MSLHTPNNQKIKDIYYGTKRIKYVYKGSQLVYLRAPYDDGQVLFESNVPGTYYLTILHPVRVEMNLVGGGAGCASKYAEGATGGSGGHSRYIMTLQEGATYTITVGHLGGNDVHTSSHSHHKTGWAGGNTSIVGENFADCVAYGGGQCTTSGQRTSLKYGNGGYGNVSSGNHGNIWYGSPSDIDLKGGESVYNGHGNATNNKLHRRSSKARITNTLYGGTTGYAKIQILKVL